MEDLGRIAYEAYYISVEGKALLTGEPLPDWTDLNSRIQDAWRHAAEAVQRQLGMERGQ